MENEGNEINFSIDRALLDPLTKGERWEETHAFLESLDPMTPDEYRRYYEEILVPLREARDSLSPPLDKLNEYRKKYVETE